MAAAGGGDLDKPARAAASQITDCLVADHKGLVDAAGACVLVPKPPTPKNGFEPGQIRRVVPG